MAEAPVLERHRSAPRTSLRPTIGCRRNPSGPNLKSGVSPERCRGRERRFMVESVGPAPA